MGIFNLFKKKSYSLKEYSRIRAKAIRHITSENKSKQDIMNKLSEFNSQYQELPSLHRMLLNKLIEDIKNSNKDLVYKKLKEYQVEEKSKEYPNLIEEILKNWWILTNDIQTDKSIDRLYNESVNGKINDFKYALLLDEFQIAESLEDIEKSELSTELKKILKEKFLAFKKWEEKVMIK